MGVLGNLDHERFCQALHARVWAGEKLAPASIAAYRETIYQGDKVDDAAIAPNARKLRNRKDVKARRIELADFSAKVSGIDASWAPLKLKGLVDSSLGEYLGPPDGAGARFFDLRNVSEKKLANLAGGVRVEGSAFFYTMTWPCSLDPDRVVIDMTKRRRATGVG